MTAATRLRRFRPLFAALSLLLALGGLVAFAAPAQAATTDITGTVTSSDGSPLPANIPIYLSAELTNGGAGPSGPMFPSTVPATTTAPDGTYTITGVAPGIYIVLADAGDDRVQGFAAAVLDGVDDPGSVADIEIEKGVLITGTVRPESNPLTTLGGIAVGAIMQCGCGGFFGDGTYFDLLTFDWDVAYPVTPGDGTYRIVVPLGESYEVNAFDPSLDPIYAEQSWDHQPGSGGCGCGSGDFTPVVAPQDTVATPWPFAPISAIDFDLRAFADYLWFQVQTVRPPGTTAYPNVHVFLQFDTGGGWVDADDAVTDSSGFVDLYAADDGDYRLRFEVAGLPVAVLGADDPCGCSGSYALDEADTKVVLGSYTKSAPGDGYFEGSDARVRFAAPSGSGGGGGGGGTPTPPRPRTPTYTTYTIDDLLPEDVTSTPTPTPSSTPSPSPSQSGEPEPTATATPDPEPAQNSVDLWWLWLILVIVLAVIIVLVARGLLRGRR
ncbi:MAG TPA: carboxypeptidase-like regulatory domain-containing protein [Pseudolysinimonas sp.]|nr:carboxypeptidase-like regulatory domain-containing protein [Pseudolysinimonas sp.]